MTSTQRAVPAPPAGGVAAGGRPFSGVRILDPTDLSAPECIAHAL